MTPEMEFRGDLDSEMKGLWTLTWHEDGTVNPGVPDTSFVMNGGEYETGWMELKAIRPPGPNAGFKFKLEPSQHRWIEAHYTRVPVMLLLAAGEDVWLVSGHKHHFFMQTQSRADMDSLGTHCLRSTTMRPTLNNYLKQSTYRNRNGA